MIASMSDTATNHLPVVSEPHGSEPQLTGQACDVGAAVITPLDALEVAPGAFVWIQVGRIVVIYNPEDTSTSREQKEGNR